MTPEQKRMASAILDALSMGRVEGRAVTAVDDDPVMQAALTANPALKVALDAGLGGGYLVGRLMTELAATRGQDVDTVLFDLREWLAGQP